MEPLSSIKTVVDSGEKDNDISATYGQNGNNDNYHSKDSSAEFGHFDDASFDKVRHKRLSCLGTRKRKAMFAVSLVLLLVTSVVILCCVFLRDIVGTILNHSKFDIKSSAISDISKDGFRLSFDTDIYRTGPVVATIEPTTLYLYDGDELLGSCSVPEQVLDSSFGSVAQMNLDTQFNLADKEKFSDFMNKIMLEKIVPWRMVCEMNLKINLLPGVVVKTIRLDKTLYIPGLDGLKGQELIGFTLPREAPCGIIMEATDRIYNPSPMGMAVGKTGFKLYYKSVLIGRLSVPSMDLKPGINEWNLTGCLNPLSPSEISIVNGFFDDFIHGRNSSVVVQGEYIYPVDEKSPLYVDWINESFRNLKMSLAIPGIKDFSPIKSVTIEGMFLDFTQDDKWNLPIVSKIRSVYSLPFGFPVQIMGLGQRIILTNRDNQTMGTALFPMAPVSSNHETKEITGKVQGFLSIDANKKEAFTQFLTEMITGNESTMGMKGSAESTMKSAQGVIHLKNLAIDERTIMKGMGSLADPPPRINSIKLTKGNLEDGLLKEIQLTLFNPSTTGSNLGPVTYDLHFREQRIGESTIDSLVLCPGENNVTALGRLLLLPDDPLLEEFLSLYVNGKYIDIEMKGTLDSSCHPLLMEPMSHFASKITFKGSLEPQVVYGKISVSILGSVFVKFKVFNPLDVPVKLAGITGYKIYYKTSSLSKEVHISSINAPLLERPAKVPPRSTVELTEWIPLVQHGGTATKKSVMYDIVANGFFVVTSEGFLHLVIDEFPVRVFYRQENIKVYYAFR